MTAAGKNVSAVHTGKIPFHPLTPFRSCMETQRPVLLLALQNDIQSLCTERQMMCSKNPSGRRKGLSLRNRFLYLIFPFFLSFIKFDVIESLNAEQNCLQ
jgi:hypothetical protein